MQRIVLVESHLATNLDITDAQTDIRDAERELVTATVDYNVAAFGSTVSIPDQGVAVYTGRNAAKGTDGKLRHGDSAISFVMGTYAVACMDVAPIE